MSESEKEYMAVVYPKDWHVTNNRNEYLEQIDYIDLFIWIDAAKKDGRKFCLYELGDCLLDWS